MKSVMVVLIISLILATVYQELRIGKIKTEVQNNYGMLEIQQGHIVSLKEVVDNQDLVIKAYEKTSQVQKKIIEQQDQIILVREQQIEILNDTVEKLQEKN